MKQWFKGELNEQWNWGGANPVVKVVLDNIGRRYLVEHWESEDGLQEYDLYSDGFIKQVVTLTGSMTEAVFPKAFANLNYKISIGSQIDYYASGTNTVQSNYGWTWWGIYNKQTTGVSRGGSAGLGSQNKVYVFAQGYAA